MRDTILYTYDGKHAYTRAYEAVDGIIKERRNKNLRASLSAAYQNTTAAVRHIGVGSKAVIFFLAGLSQWIE